MAEEIDKDCEEEILVYAELADSVNIEKYNNIHILGVETNNPIIQMDDTFFTGFYENPLGTYMFFEENHLPQCTDPVFDKIPEKNVKYVCKTRKIIKVEHGYITPKDSTGLNNSNSSQQDLENDIKAINFKTAQEAVDTFKQEWSSNETMPIIKF